MHEYTGPATLSFHQTSGTFQTSNGFCFSRNPCSQEIPWPESFLPLWHHPWPTGTPCFHLLSVPTDTTGATDKLDVRVNLFDLDRPVGA